MKKRKVLSLLIAVAMLATCFAAAPALAKSKKVKKGPALVKAVIVKTYDDEDKKWEKDYKEVYKYKKKYPTLIRRMEYNSNQISESVYKFKFKGKKAKSVVGMNALKQKWGTAKFSKGLRVKYTEKNYPGAYYRYNTKGTYKWKKGFIVQHKRNSTTSYKGEKNTYINNSTYKYKIAMKKGLPKKIAGTYESSSATKGETPSKSSPDDTKYTGYYGKAGIIKMVGEKYGTEKEEVYRKYAVKFKKGRVARVIQYKRNKDYDTGKVTYRASAIYSFAYTKEKISKQRYCNMINDILDVGDTYGKFCWY